MEHAMNDDMNYLCNLFWFVTCCVAAGYSDYMIYEIGYENRLYKLVQYKKKEKWEKKTIFPTYLDFKSVLEENYITTTVDCVCERMRCERINRIVKIWEDQMQYYNRYIIQYESIHRGMKK